MAPAAHLFLGEKIYILEHKGLKIFIPKKKLKCAKNLEDESLEGRLNLFLSHGFQGAQITGEGLPSHDPSVSFL